MLRSTIAIFALISVCFISLDFSAQSDMPSAISFSKNLQSDFAKGNSENETWIRKVFSPIFLNSSLSKSVQDTIVSTTLHLQSINLKNSSGIIGYLRGVAGQKTKGGGKNSINT